MAKRRRKKTEPSLFDLPEHLKPDEQGNEESVALHEAAQTRYLNYALSVITSRALPDVRDGLKPVQRRILFTMWQQHLTSNSKYRKCAKIVGDVMGSYHPHGDVALYETLVRMAQPFSLRYPLVDGSGNFGSLDGDRAAAMRYTECRLAHITGEMLAEIDQRTVPFRPNYDGTKNEPVVLPTKFPNLLINGAMGIAVGMATNIPPHNLSEICTALIKLLDNPDLSSSQLCRYVQGPDFPTGGQILNTPSELKSIYETGSGSIRLRGTWELSATTRSSKTIYVTSIPYAVNKTQLIEKIAEIILSRKLPPLLDVKDLSTDEVRISLELKRDADERMVMAYLCKHTPLQTSFIVNMTCLVPTENQELGRPERLDLHTVLWHFLRFRLDVVTGRFEHELEILEKRIHILEGFEKIFDSLDSILRIIRRSDGKSDAAKKIVRRFGLDAEQTDAILELKLYRLARLEILVITKELGASRKRKKKITTLLKSEADRWEVVRQEISEILKTYGAPKIDRRRTVIKTVENDIEISADAFIVEEDNVVIVSCDGWVKRQKEVRDPKTTRLREGDSVLSVLVGSTRASVVFFTNFGFAYTCRIVDVPASTGYGEPIQRLFKFKDGESVVAAFSLDSRVTGQLRAKKKGAIPPTHAIAATSDGYGLRFGLEWLQEPSTRAGRRYARPAEGVTVVGVERIQGDEVLIAATEQAHVMLCQVGEVNYLSGPGKGVIIIKFQANSDRVLGFTIAKRDRDRLVMETSRGGTQSISTAKYEVTGRGGKGRVLLQRAKFIRVVPPAMEVIDPIDSS